MQKFIDLTLSDGRKLKVRSYAIVTICPAEEDEDHDVQEAEVRGYVKPNCHISLFGSSDEYSVQETAHDVWALIEAAE